MRQIINLNRKWAFSKAATAPWYVEDYNANFIEGCEWAMPSVPKVPGYTEEETVKVDLDDL